MQVTTEVESEVFTMEITTNEKGTISRKAFADAVKSLRAKYGKKARKLWYFLYEDCNLWYYAETEKPRKWPRRYATLIK